jgi:hypothetical protein
VSVTDGAPSCAKTDLSNAILEFAPESRDDT